MTDMTMTCAELDVRLADYLNDALSAAERAAVDAHLATCARCAGVLAALDEVPAASPKLPVLAPKHDLWSGIAERIEPRVLTLGERPARAAAPKNYRAARLLAAAIILVTGTALITRQAMLRPEPPAPAAVAANPGGSLMITPVADRHEQLIRTYDAEIQQLDSAVRLRRNQLDTTTVKIIEKNLLVIDKAIMESRAALAKDPKSHFLNEQLTRVLDQKVGLLRTAALLPTRT
jgi:anti-sigma-K factor RskA